MIFDDELARLLDADPVLAREKYEGLVVRLRKFFDWRQCESSEDLVQEVFARVVRRRKEGVTIQEDPVRYIFGIARLVLHEDRRSRPVETRAVPLTDDLVARGEVHARADTRMLLRQALTCLAPEEQTVLMRYYSIGGPALARELDTSEGALRLRVHRLLERVRAANGETPARLRKVK